MLSDRSKIYANDDLGASDNYQRLQGGNGTYRRRTQFRDDRNYSLDTYANTTYQLRPANISRVPNSPPAAVVAAAGVRPKTRRLHFSNAVFVTAKSSNLPRRGGVRRLPATPAEPSLLNIDNLAPSHSVDQNFSTRTRHMLGVDLVNFPRLESSPTRMKLLMQSVGKLRGHVGAADTSVQPLSHAVPQRQAVVGSRSLDDSMTFEEAIIAGRGTRQLPVIGPQQLLQVGSGRGGRVGSGRRELPRPGTSVDLTMNPGLHGTNGMTIHPATSAYLDSDDEEEWC